jgi:polar amino acid transport system substrate-binding protein
MNFNQRLLGLVFSGSLALWSANVQAQTGTGPAPVRAAIMQTEPWGFLSKAPDGGKAGAPVGILLDIAARIEAEAGVTMVKTLKPYARVWQELDLGSADISFLIRSADREGQYKHAGHLFDFGTVVLADKKHPLANYEALGGLRIGLMRGIRLSPRFDADTSLNKVEVRDYETMVQMLREGRLDAIAGNSVSLHYLVKLVGMEALVGKQWVLQVTPVTVHVSQLYGDHDALKRIETAVQRLKRQGAFESIIDRWVGRDWRVN